MKFLIALLFLIPTLSLANVYNCSGAGFIVDVAGTPLDMKISGNGFDTLVKNLHVTSTFETIISGNINNPPTTFKLIVKDSSFGNPGDTFKGSLQVSSAAGVKDFTGLICIRGND